MDTLEAISLNLAGEVKRQLAEGTIQLDAPNAEGVTPVEEALSAAIQWRDPAILQMLQAAAADLEPLFKAIQRRLDSLPETLLHTHNSTTKCINAVVDGGRGKESWLDGDEREKLKAFLISAQAFDTTSSSLREKTLSLGKAISQREAKALDAAVAYLIDVARFQFEAMRLRMESVTIEDFFAST